MPLFDFYIMVDWSGAKYARCGLVNVPATIASMGTGHVSQTDTTMRRIDEATN